MDFRKRTIKSFATIFDGEAESGNLIGEEDRETMGRNTDEAFSERWGYFGLMYRLTGGDVLKLEKVAELQLYVAFTWLCYETDLEITNKNQRRNARK